MIGQVACPHSTWQEVIRKIAQDAKHVRLPDRTHIHYEARDALP
ncbi:hypothetical protein L479_01726 [Exiguobacterium sp. S17]|nr:hypothetical protein L479_01726 [Exiguobacterium sp. S17]